jgi:hypothetical protein
MRRVGSPRWTILPIPPAPTLAHDPLDRLLTETTSLGTITYTYAPFWETAVSGLQSASPFQFTSRENDGTGLYYYRAR